jgi:hypothetical protein
MFVTFYNFNAGEYARTALIRSVSYVLGWGSLINFFFVLHKNQK